MEKVFIGSEVEGFTHASFLRAECDAETLFCGFQQVVSVVAGQAEIALELGLRQTLFRCGTCQYSRTKAANSSNVNSSMIQ